MWGRGDRYDRRGINGRVEGALCNCDGAGSSTPAGYVERGIRLFPGELLDPTGCASSERRLITAVHLFLYFFHSLPPRLSSLHPTLFTLSSLPILFFTPPDFLHAVSSNTPHFTLSDFGICFPPVSRIQCVIPWSAQSISRGITGRCVPFDVIATGNKYPRESRSARSSPFC